MSTELPQEYPIDRQGRDRLAEAMEGFLNRGMTKLDLEDQIEELPWEVEDPALEHVAAVVMGRYAHFGQYRYSDHLSKRDRDFFYRLLLLLRSDGQVEFTRRRGWDFWQALALLGVAISFLSFGLLANYTYFLLTCIPLGALVGIILRARAQRLTEWEGDRGAMRPFSSILEILQARRSVPDFQKRRNAPRLSPEKTFHYIFDQCSLFPILVGTIVFSPFLLIWLAFPYYQTKTRVVFHA